MSHMRSTRDLIELSEGQGFIVHALTRSGAYRVMPKSSGLKPVVIYDTRSRESSQTKYLNTRSELRRIGVKFPECGDIEPNKPKKDAEMETRKPTMTVPLAAAAAVNGATPPVVAKSPIAPPAEFPVLARIRQKAEAVQLAVMELEQELVVASQELGPLFEMQQLLQRLSVKS